MSSVNHVLSFPFPSSHGLKQKAKQTKARQIKSKQPNLVSIVDYYDEDKTLYLVLE